VSSGDSLTKPAPLLDVRDLSVAFDTDDGPLTAVDGVSFRVERGEVVGLVGESGCGKSVTALSLLRLIPSPPGRLVSGTVLFRGRDLLRVPARELRDIRGRAISTIFQEPMSALSPLHRIGHQLVETVRLHEALGRAEAWRRSVEWLGRVGIPDPEERMYAYPYHLSGGMLQRVVIAMALMLHPALVIADEPTTALDVTIQAQILQLMAAMRDRDTALLLITHDLGVIWEMCTRVLVMYAGRIVEEGPSEPVFRRPCHPYTRALLSTIVSLFEPGARLRPIEGQVPSPLEYPPGCRFAPRCGHAVARCRVEDPELEPLGPERRAACLLAQGFLDRDDLGPVKSPHPDPLPAAQGEGGSAPALPLRAARGAGAPTCAHPLPACRERVGVRVPDAHPEPPRPPEGSA
jgi:peptide/nickel transport system ATP-binding protein/oligopeptide transport system ATP-binding protein